MTAGSPRILGISGRILFGAAVLLVPLAGCIKLQKNMTCLGPSADVQWSITNSQGAVVDCDSAGAANVTLYLSDFKQTFPCGVQAGHTKKLALGGTYTQRGQLTSLNGSVIAETAPVSVAIEDCDVTTVPALTFTLSDTCTS